jgi:predicted GNAT family N-acyltransferase
MNGLNPRLRLDKPPRPRYKRTDLRQRDLFMNRPPTSVQRHPPASRQTPRSDISQNTSVEDSPQQISRRRVSCALLRGEVPSSAATEVVIRLATTNEERDAIYRLRYQVYIEEMNGAHRHQEADVGKQQLRDAWDDRAYHFYALQQGEVVACARILMRRDGPLECEEHFELERFGASYPYHLGMTSRLALHPGHRGSHLLKQLTCAMYAFVRQEGVHFNFIDCHTRLLPLYSRLGFRAYRSGFNHAQYTYVVPMVLVVDDLEYMEQVKSPFVPIAKQYPCSSEGRRLLLAQFSDAASLLDLHGYPAAHSRERMLERLIGGNQPPASNMLDGLTREDVPLLASLGHYVTCRAGDAVLRTGDPGRDIFLILDGRFEVSGRIRHAPQEEIQVRRTLSAGDVFGEIRFLTEEIRYATVTAVEHSTLLVLNAKALDRLVITAPKIAAKMFRNIARIVVSRLCPAHDSAPAPSSP